MKRNLLALAVAAATAMPMVAQAAPTVYGRLNLSLDATTSTNNTVTPSVKSSNWEVNSNASRVGIKGNERLTDEYTAVYKAEWEVAGDTQGAADLTGRERYIGLKNSNYGTVRLGAMDSPLKTSEDDVDVFNDLVHLDMKSILSGQDRLNNSINYVSPKILDVFGANVTFQPGESGKIAAGNSKNHLADAYSAAFSYEDDSLYLSVAFNKKVMSTIATNPAMTSYTSNARNATRLVARYKMNDFEVAGLIQKSKLDKDAKLAAGDKADETSYVLSASYNMDKLSYKGELGRTTLKVDDAGNAIVDGKDTITLAGLGLDYNFSQTTKVFTDLASIKHNYGSGNTTKSMQLGGGVEIRF